MKFFSKIKYPLLKLIDISGFKVFDPVVRLIYKEEPQKQIRDILRFMFLPILFMIGCLLIWNWAGPNHKTKSGEVPTPGKVWVAFKDSWRFDEREDEKEQAFKLTGAEREEELASVKTKLTELETEAAALQTESTKVATEVKSEMDAKIAPVKSRLDALKAEIKTAKAERKTALTALSEKMASGQASPESLISLVEDHNKVQDDEKAKLKVINDELNEIRDNPPKRLKEAQLAANKLADEVQHYKKRIDYLTTGNRELKVASLEEKAKLANENLAKATTAAEASKFAKNL